ncbi:hypothetical protein LEP1GSC034_3358 [Leptospira interrogans str. 2003000735]|uniref:Uncharacterized protein n=2 Tax=Leptospira interrogans TaxID=173 RepID=A0A829D6A9_LEPIR|nr:hypothetical protein LEP1GSC027_4294 [Leptospira interrogans str. 2002000624]EKQ48331.1 hypothetical protein LEP1GSC026_4261 [Leptospira interrogans str. 2002000623]EMJ71010.1 hypothetical protein LEP1GSC034_3358 [Leptospira interrogans str. 2003000735]EMJ73859.1 hypothetical protein LEP1GSC033_4007 [Leptospira interrogans str. 2002000632]EMY05917.1 hypothetical protein LEP1GSC029_0649 [Leptospira interrogans str. 2002000626]EMY23754.1 hypothetical protein LEP1GSC115_2342 [Leptospira interr
MLKKNETRSKIIENKEGLSNVSSAMIHFSEKSWHLNFTDLLKCGNYHKLQFYEQILKL